ncbi:MAG: alkaline phosphatase family protein [Polyangiaceae bacterium]|jgi:hypothetical protein|nr:alkaline phosphatase family protein [Polyangiaceae bacterium]
MRTLVVFVDALGPALLERLRRRLPWLSSSRGLRGELGYSSGALATILTGKTTAEHGRFCLFSAHQGAGAGPLAPLRWLGLLPSLIHERGGVRRRVAQAFARLQGWSGYFALHRVPPELFPWLDVPERDDLFQTPAINGAPTFLAQARRRGLRVLSARWQLGEQQRWREALAAIEHQDSDLIFLYSAELDGLLHQQGASGPGIDAALDRLAERIDRARDHALRRGPLRTLVVGDHGMAEIHSVIDPRPVTRSLPGRLFIDSTLARFWGSERELAQIRARTERWPGRWLGPDELRRLGVQGATGHAPHGDAMLALDEGHLFAPSFVGGVVRGMHGYMPDSASAVAGVASDQPLPELASLRDVAPFVLESLA